LLGLFYSKGISQLPGKRIRKSEKIPPYGTVMRNALMEHLPESKQYLDNLKKGLPFFSQEELEDIKNRYQDGLVWEDIERELLRKNIILKKATFRKYIQENRLPEAKKYRKINRRRMAVFPPDTVSHINFVLYCYKVVDGKMMDNLLSALTGKDEYFISYREAIETKLSRQDDLRSAILHYICLDDAEAHTAIEEGLCHEMKDRQKALTLLDEITKKFESIIDKEISKLITFLEDKHINISGLTDEKK
jgi:hypothetical protein